MVVLGIDPGFATVGYGVVRKQGNKLEKIQYGTITTKAGKAFETRLCEIYADLNTLIDTFKPDAMAVEELFFNTNVKTAISVAHARGIILLAGALKNLPVYEYTPLQVKQAVVGYGRAEKQQVMEMTRQMLGLANVPKPDDAADALAIAICHLHTAGSRMFGR